MTRTWIISAVLSLCIGVTFADSQTPASAKIPRPTLFAPDDENRGFEDAVPPSDIVLDALLNTAEAQDASEELKALGRESKRKLFSVVRIQIGGINEEDYIVTGRQPMSGADNI